jgi:hypothetical protein
MRGKYNENFVELCFEYGVVFINRPAEKVVNLLTFVPKKLGVRVVDIN